MKLEDQVISLEIAKELKELGVKQESLFYWANPYLEKHAIWQLDDVVDWSHQEQFKDWFNEHNGENNLKDNSYSAFTVAELGKLLPTTIDNKYNDCTLWINMRNMHHSNDTHQYCIWYENNRPKEKIKIVADTEANVRGKMIIYLIKSGLEILNEQRI